MNTAVTIDKRLAERRRQRQAHTAPPAPILSQPTTSSQPRGTITSAERERRRDNNLRLYCGNAGLTAGSCPVSLSSIPALTLDTDCHEEFLGSSTCHRTT